MLSILAQLNDNLKQASKQNPQTSLAPSLSQACAPVCCIAEFFKRIVHLQCCHFLGFCSSSTLGVGGALVCSPYFWNCSCPNHQGESICQLQWVNSPACHTRALSSIEIVDDCLLCYKHYIIKYVIPVKGGEKARMLSCL